MGPHERHQVNVSQGGNGLGSPPGCAPPNFLHDKPVPPKGEKGPPPPVVPGVVRAPPPSGKAGQVPRGPFHQQAKTGLGKTPHVGAPFPRRHPFYISRVRGGVLPPGPTGIQKDQHLFPRFFFAGALFPGGLRDVSVPELSSGLFFPPPQCSPRWQAGNLTPRCRLNDPSGRPVSRCWGAPPKGIRSFTPRQGLTKLPFPFSLDRVPGLIGEKEQRPRGKACPPRPGQPSALFFSLGHDSPTLFPPPRPLGAGGRPNCDSQSWSHGWLFDVQAPPISRSARSATTHCEMIQRTRSAPWT